VSVQRFGVLVRHQRVVVEADADDVGSVMSFEAFYEDNFLRAARLARLITGSVEIGQDVAQEAFLAAHRRWQTIVNPEAYLRVAIVNLSRSVQRRQIRERLKLEMSTQRRHSLPPDVDEMWTQLQRLPIEQRTVLVLRFYEDMSVSDIASDLGRPVGTIKSVLHRALERLREDLR
jgi:RNA polymerase sigma factor (sigma-70 family)